MATGMLLKLLLFAGATLVLEADAKHRRKGRSVASDEGSEEIYGHRRALVFFDPEVFGTKSPEKISGGMEQKRDEILDSPLEAPKDTSAEKKSMLSQKVRNVSHRRFLNEVPGQDINKYLEENEDEDDDEFMERRKQSEIDWDSDGDIGDKPMSRIDESISAIRRAAFNVMINNSTNKYPRLGEKVSSKLLAEKLKELLASNQSRGSIKEFYLNEQTNENPLNLNFQKIMKKMLEKNKDKMKKKRLRRPVCKLDVSIKRFVFDFEKSIDRGSLKILPNRYNDNFYIPLRYYNYLVKLKARLSKGPRVKFEYRDQ